MIIRFLIADAYSVGGTIRATFNTAAELARRHDVEIVSVIRGRDDPELRLDPRVRLRPLTDLRPRSRSPWWAWAARQRSRVIDRHDVRHAKFNARTDIHLLAFLRSVREGVLIGTRPGLNLAIARFARRSVVRVGQDHMNLGAYQPELRSAIAARYPRLDLVTALTRGSAHEYADLLGPGTRVECMPNGTPGADGCRARPEATEVVAAGQLTRRKGFDRLLRAWARVANDHPAWRLRVFGSGPAEQELSMLADDLCVADSVSLEGYTPRLREKLAAASLFAMSSRHEGFPMVLLEAMSVGLPVVAYDCPTGPRDIVTGGIDGYIVPDGFTEGFAATLDGLMSDEDERRRLGDAAVEKASQFRIDAIAARWEALLADVAASKRGSAADA